jgi:hypothetical protein
MSKIAALIISVLMLALAGSAFAQDFRSPDAKPAVVAKQDYRSPDAKPAVVAKQDYRSPDAQPSGQFQPSAPTSTNDSSSSFNWGYLAIIVAIPLLLLLGVVLTLRRRHDVAVGS